MVGVTLAGPELRGLVVEQPAASVRLLLPAPGADHLEMPTWDGNQFILGDGERATIRTFTPRRVDPEGGELDLWIVMHGGGVASDWAASARPGDVAALSGPGRGYDVDPEAPAILLAGDETAIPAISQLLEVIPAATQVHAHIEVAHADGRLPLAGHPTAVVTWHEARPDAPPGDALVAAVRRFDLHPEARVWAAGEAAAMHRIRTHLFEERGWPRASTTVRGYWKHGRRGV
jgi:NADPH-dependent ferric siderophore reductase